MTDQELLEAAAKAAGYTLGRHTQKAAFTLGGGEWNPLTDAGDALRLAITLHLPISFPLRTKEEPARVHCGRYWDNSAGVWYPFEELFGDDPYAATRRAIVRAAAAIGKGK